MSVPLIILLLLSFAESKRDLAFWPQYPFVDGCDGKQQKNCGKLGQCGWFTDQIPWCYDKLYRQVEPIPSKYPQVDVAKRFFNYLNGVHLSEGTQQKIYYNTNHEECGLLCLTSTLKPLNVRCLSFDFYEFPVFTLPDEKPSPNRGVCVLNSGNKDDSRLRNVDQGYTDEELFSNPSDGGHYRLRLSNFGGHYQVRNPRGGQLAQQLDYPMDSPLDFNKTYVWAGSRWGIAHLPPFDGSPVPTRPNKPIDCTTPEVNPPGPNAQLTYYGGFTPIGLDQHCVGLQDKDTAAKICTDSGGFLCATQKIVASLEGRKIGCSYDNDPVWSAADVPLPNQKKFVRCCAKYSFNNVCQKQYSQEDISYCAKWKTFHDCNFQGSGYVRQAAWGFGKLLQSYRQSCVDSNYKPINCTKALVQDWQPRDRCIWCLEPGTGAGSCRAGSDFGVCQAAPPEPAQRFANIMNLMCGKETTCRVANAYPDLSCLLLNQCKNNTIPIINVQCSTLNAFDCSQNSLYCVWVDSQRQCIARTEDDS